MIAETLPIRNKLIELQREGVICIDNFTYGLNRRESYVNIAFEINKTHERVVRTMTGKTMQEAADSTMELLNQLR